MSKPQFDSIDVQGKVADGDLVALSRMQFIISLGALIGGILLMALGALFVYLGFTGSIKWSLSALGVESKLADASPGIVMMVVGIIMIALNRFSVKSRK